MQNKNKLMFPKKSIDDAPKGILKHEKSALMSYKKYSMSTAKNLMLLKKVFMSKGVYVN